MSIRRNVTASAFLLDTPAPVFHLDTMIHVEQRSESQRRAGGQSDWLAHIPVESLLKLSFETSGPQGVLGMPNPGIAASSTHAHLLS